jgi:hypothetical protein
MLISKRVNTASISTRVTGGVGEALKNTQWLDSGFERGVGLFNPADRIHVLEQRERLLEQAAAIHRIVRRPEATIGEQALGQFRAGLDGAQDIQAAPVLGLGLLSIVSGLVDLSKQAVGGSLF